MTNSSSFFRASSIANPQAMRKAVTFEIRSPIGDKTFPPDLKEISRIGQEIEQHISMVPGTRSASA